MKEVKGTILIVDDDEFLTSLYAEKFIKFGYAVEAAKNGEDGMNMIEKLHPDAVILDILMPGENGIDMLKKLRANPKTKNQLVLVLSNLDEKAKIAECQHQNVFDYIIKAHVTPDEIINQVQNMLETGK